MEERTHDGADGATVAGDADGVLLLVPGRNARNGVHGALLHLSVRLAPWVNGVAGRIAVRRIDAGKGCFDFGDGEVFEEPHVDFAQTGLLLNGQPTGLGEWGNGLDAPHEVATVDGVNWESLEAPAYLCCLLASGSVEGNLHVTLIAPNGVIFGLAVSDEQ